MRIFLTCVLLALCFTSAQARESIATLKTMSGQAWVVRDTKTIQAEPGMALFETDLLSTDADSSAGISFMDGSRVSLGPASQMEINAYRFAPKDQNYAFEVHFRKGTACYSSGRLEKLAPEAVRFSTPQAALGVRGTTFLVRVE